MRIPLPELNEQRRKELVKIAHDYAENARVAARHVRRDGMDILKKAEKDHAISEDEHREAVRPGAEDDRRDDIHDRQLAIGKGSRNHAGLSDPKKSRKAADADASARCDHHGRQRPLGEGARACRAWPAIAPASRRCAGPFAPPARQGIPWLTVYAFSSENWSRPKSEVSDLMGLLKLFIRRDLAELHQSGVRVRIIGDRDGPAGRHRRPAR